MKWVKLWRGVLLKCWLLKRDGESKYCMTSGLQLHCSEGQFRLALTLPSPPGEGNHSCAIVSPCIAVAGAAFEIKIDFTI